MEHLLFTRQGNVGEIMKSHGNCGLPVMCYRSCDSHKINITWVLLSKVDMHKMYCLYCHNTRTMFTVLSSWLTVIARVHPVHAMDAEQHQTSADLWTKPTDLSHRPACKQLRHYIHHRLLLLLSQKADTHFTIRQGRTLNRPRWLVTYPNGLPVCKQSPIRVVIGLSVD